MSEFPNLFSEDEIDRLAGHLPPPREQPTAAVRAKPEPPPRAVENHPEAELERHHPRVVERLVLFWGHAEFEPYVTSLTIDWRGGRQGFSPAVLAELIFLQTLHHARGFGTNGGSPWSDTLAR